MAYYGLGYDVIGHISNYKLISKIIPNLYERNKGNFCVSLQCGEVVSKHEFTEVCKEYLGIYSEQIMEQDVFSLPCDYKVCCNTTSSLESPFVTIMKTMKGWCSKNRKKGYMKGFAIYDQNSELPLNILQNDRNRAVAERGLHETIIAYNPTENVIFLIRRAKDKNLQNEMKLSTNDITKFLLLYNDVLTKSGVKVINLLVTDDKFDDDQWMCESCKHQIISMESLSTPNLFQKWWEIKNRKFNISFVHKHTNRNFAFEFFAKSFGFFALYHFSNILPSISRNPVGQMTEKILLTPEQMKIVYSSHKHLMIKGCYGSGKSTVGRIKAEMLCRELKQEEALHYVLYDSRSKPVAEMRTTPKINHFCNRYGLKLKDIIDKILKDNQTKQKINLIVDGMDIQDLDEEEAEKINEAFTTNDKLKDSTIFLIFQPLEKERIVSSTGEKKDMASFLKSMKSETLTYIMRTTIEINSLVKATIDALKDQVIVFPGYYRGTENPRYQVYFANTTEQKENTQTAGYQVVSTGQQANKERISGIGEVAKPRTKNEPCFSETLTSRENIGIEEAEDVQKCRQGKSYDDTRKFTLASEHSMSIRDKSCTNNIVASKFRYVESFKSGTNIHSETPSLYEICYPEESAEFKMLLMIILRKVMSEKVEVLADEILCFDDLTGIFNIKKHVILHFNAENDIPKPFDTVFKLMRISEKVTVKYEEFNREKEKKVLICSYLTFRGLEYPHVIVAVDPSVCFVKHYLPELLTRSTSFLHIIALKELNHGENWMLDGTLDKMIGDWKNPIKGPPLVKQWKIEIINSEKKFAETSQSVESGRLEKICFRIGSNVYREIEKNARNCSSNKKGNRNQVSLKR